MTVFWLLMVLPVAVGWLMTEVTSMGDIGPAREIEFEPLPETAPEPVQVPAPAPEPVKEPAHV